MGECGLDSSVSAVGPVTDSCEHGSEPSGFMKDGQFLYCTVVILNVIFYRSTVNYITTSWNYFKLINSSLSRHASTFTVSSSRVHS
jgi:hypothetical protein